MEIPLTIFAIAYCLVVGAITIIGGLNVYTALKHGMRTAATTTMSIFFVFGIVVIIFGTAVVVAGADWTGAVSIGTPDMNIPTFIP